MNKPFSEKQQPTVEPFNVVNSVEMKGIEKYLLLLVATEVGLHPFVSAFIIFGWLKAIYNRENMILEIVLFLSSLFFVAMQHWVIDYYNIVWLPFLAIALLRIASIRLPESLMRPTVQAQIPLLMTALLLILPMVNNRSALGRLVISNEETAIDGQSYVAQPQFATAMRKNTDSRQQPTMIMINSLDKGFYLSAQALPTTRFWHRLNMSYQQLPQMYDAFANTMCQKQVQFVIIKLNTPPENDATLLKEQINRAIDSHLQQPLFKTAEPIVSVTSDLSKSKTSRPNLSRLFSALMSIRFIVATDSTG